MLSFASKNQLPLPAMLRGRHRSHGLAGPRCYPTRRLDERRIVLARPAHWDERQYRSTTPGTLVRSPSTWTQPARDVAHRAGPQTLATALMHSSGLRGRDPGAPSAGRRTHARGWDRSPGDTCVLLFQRRPAVPPVRPQSFLKPAFQQRRSRSRQVADRWPG